MHDVSDDTHILPPAVAGGDGLRSSSSGGLLPAGRIIARAVSRKNTVVEGHARRVSGPRGSVIISRKLFVGRTAHAVIPNRTKAPSGKIVKTAGLLPVGRPEKGAPRFSPQGRILVNSRVVIVPPLQRVVSMLAYLRGLSPYELTGIRLEQYNYSKDVRDALTIRARAQTIIERIKTLPLREISTLRGIKISANEGGGGTESAGLSPGELLARGEVGFMIRELVNRLQRSMSPGSMLYKRVTTELTLAELERLVSILDGRRPTRGLGKMEELKEGVV